MKIKAKILSPVHIFSGDEYEKDFNFFIKNNIAYLIDEFKIISKFPNSYDRKDDKIILKENIKNKIIEENFYKRRIKTSFNSFEKPLLENISSNNKPYIPASSIKGAIKSAILNCLANYSDMCKKIYKFLNRKNFDCTRINDTLDKDLEIIFKNIRVKEVYPSFSTRIYKTINIKVCKDLQKNRQKTERIANFVEAIEPNQEFIFEIDDKLNLLDNLSKICNVFYFPKIKDDIVKIRSGCIKKDCSNLKEDKDGFYYENYFYKKGSVDINFELSNKTFLLNISKFSGAVKKSLDNLRYIKDSHCNNKKYTTTKTFALDKPYNNDNLYENSLIPFGWVLCEIIK